MLNVPGDSGLGSQLGGRERQKASSMYSLAIPDFDIGYLPSRTGTIPSNSIESEESSEKLNQEPTQDVMDMMKSFNVTHQNAQEMLEQPYDARFCVAVLGGHNCGKEKIIFKECKEDPIYISDTSINILRKFYKTKYNCLVEYWIAPDSSDYLVKSAKMMTGLAATIFVFDVTDNQSLTNLMPWVNSMQGSDGTAMFGHFGILLANRVDQPGLRVILEDEGKKFAAEHNLEYVEYVPTDESNPDDGTFGQFVGKIADLIPDDMSRKHRENGTNKGNAPIGLQLGLALDPWEKFKYRERLNRDCIYPGQTLVADWFVTSATPAQ